MDVPMGTPPRSVPASIIPRHLNRCRLQYALTLSKRAGKGTKRLRGDAGRKNRSAGQSHWALPSTRWCSTARRLRSPVVVKRVQWSGWHGNEELGRSGTDELSEYGVAVEDTVLGSGGRVRVR
jgi:hypothetical protein